MSELQDFDHAYLENILQDIMIDIGEQPPGVGTTVVLTWPIFALEQIAIGWSMVIAMHSREMCPRCHFPMVIGGNCISLPEITTITLAQADRLAQDLGEVLHGQGDQAWAGDIILDRVPDDGRWLYHQGPTRFEFSENVVAGLQKGLTTLVRHLKEKGWVPPLDRLQEA